MQMPAPQQSLPVHMVHLQQPPSQQQHSASQLSGMGPSQLLLPSQGPTGSIAFLAAALPAAPQGSQETLQASAEGSQGHEISKPQVPYL